MTDYSQILARLKRPRLLVRAAHHGLSEYNRNKDLRRLLKGSPPPPAVAVERLIDEEAELEEARRGSGAPYSVTRHVDVMIAILAEMRLIGRATSV